MHRKLATRGYDEHLINEILAELRAKRLLSDQRFAEEYVESRVRRGYGPLRIRAELNERGIDDTLVEEVVDANADFWQEQIAAVRKKRFGQKSPNDFQERAKQARFLQYRGFTSDQIREAFKADVND